MPRVAVIGAGAAGTMAAIFAASAGADTQLVERTSDGGRKILISGGGRCNILPAALDETRFVTDSPPHLLRRILRAWPLRDQRAFFEHDAGIPLAEEAASGKLFPASNRARDVRDALLRLARGCGVRITTGMRVTGLRLRQTSPRWIVELQDAEPLIADAVVLATGGLSVPKTGSDGTGLQIAASLGHRIHTTYAALTPLLAHPTPFQDLSGVSVPVSLLARSCQRRAAATGGLLFTHRGYSGPAVLDVSHVAVRSRTEEADPASITVRWSALDEQAWRQRLTPAGSHTVRAAVARELPQRLADALLRLAGVDLHTPLAQLTRPERTRLLQMLVAAPLPWTGDEGYAKAEVTGGGVALDEIDVRTMQSRRHGGLFLCGEMLDAFGPIGGYNFFWAWATGRAAGLGAAAAR